MSAPPVALRVSRTNTATAPILQGSNTAFPRGSIATMERSWVVLAPRRLEAPIWPGESLALLRWTSQGR